MTTRGKFGSFSVMSPGWSWGGWVLLGFGFVLVYVYGVPNNLESLCWLLGSHSIRLTALRSGSGLIACWVVVFMTLARD